MPQVAHDKDHIRNIGRSARSPVLVRATCPDLLRRAPALCNFMQATVIYAGDHRLLFRSRRHVADFDCNFSQLVFARVPRLFALSVFSRVGQNLAMKFRKDAAHLSVCHCAEEGDLPVMPSVHCFVVRQWFFREGWEAGQGSFLQCNA